MKNVKNEIKKVRIISNNKEECIEKANRLMKILLDEGFEVVKGLADLVVFIGGDGTFLSGCQMIDFSSETICIGINTGTLGILQNYDGTLKDLVNILKDAYELNIKEVPYLEVTLNLRYDKPVTLKALNEVSLIGDGLSLFKFDEWINNKYFQTGCSGGVVVSSYLGSTGMSKDFYSPILIDEKQLLLRSIIGANFYKTEPFLTNPVVCSEYRIDLENIYKSAKLQIDGKINKDINISDVISIRVKYSKLSIRMLYCCKEESRVELIRKKLIEK